MSKRYYLSDIVNDPDLGWCTVAMRDAGPGVRVVNDIQIGPNGAPLHAQALCYIAAKGHARWRNMPGVDPIPDVPLDGKVREINSGTVNALKQVLTRRGIPQSIVEGKDDYREVVRGVGRQFNPNFDENKFDVSDV